jgi:hypothetical protein
MNKLNLYYNKVSEYKKIVGRDDEELEIDIIRTMYKIDGYGTANIRKCKLKCQTNISQAELVILENKKFEEGILSDGLENEIEHA